MPVSGAGFGLGLALGLFISDVPDPIPETFTLSTTLRLPANDCAIRFASSRSFCDGTDPFSAIESAETSTETPLLVRVGSLRNAVWMSVLTWSEDSPAPVVEAVCPAGEPMAGLEPDWSVAEGVEDGDEGEVDALGGLDCDPAGAWLWSAEGVLGVAEGLVELCALFWSLAELLWLPDCSPMKLLCMKLCGGFDGGVEGDAFGVLFGFAVVGGFSFMLPLEGEEEEGDVPLTPVVLLLPAEVPTLEEPAAGLLLAETVSSSFTPMTPGTDFASFFASFLSFLLGTVPVSETLPLLTAISTFCKSGLVASCS
jgi:hypothetical protein